MRLSSGSVSLPAVLIVSAVALCVALTVVRSHAQGNATSSSRVTPIQVRVELEELMDTGYNPWDFSLPRQTLENRASC
jgi:hypothetical protein